MEVTRALLLVCLLTLSLLAQCSLASPVVFKEQKTLVPGAIQSALAALRTRRAANELEPAVLVEAASADSGATGLLSRLRRSMAHMYTGSIHYNSHRRGNRNGRRRSRRRHRHHHRRHGGGRVYEA